MKRNFKDGLAGFSDQKLLAIARSEHGYSDEARGLVETELERRGGREKVIETVNAAPKYREPEWNGLTEEKITKAIKSGSNAAIFMTIFAVASLAAGIINPRTSVGVLWYLLILTGVFGWLAYGIRRRSRACAIIMLVLVIAIIITTLLQGGFIGILALVVIYYLIKGISGTFAYHARREEGEFLEDLAQTGALEG